MLSIIVRTIFTVIGGVVFTSALGLTVIVAAIFRMKDRPGSPYDWVPRVWSKLLLAGAGVTVRVHGAERATAGPPRIFVSNHVSWFDVPTLASFLPWPKFVAKAELFKVPLFGWSIRSAGMIELDRENRKAALESYKLAAARMQGGNSVVVFPEATRGTSYPLRAFKKGPFVLAIAAGVPVVPMLVHGTLDVMPKGKIRVHPGAVDVHLLEPVETTGLGYDDRDRLMATVRDRMAEALRAHYGIDSPPTRIRDRASGSGDRERDETQTE